MANRIYEHPLSWNCASEAEKALERSRYRKYRPTRLARDVDFSGETLDCHSSHIERIHLGKAHLPA